MCDRDVSVQDEAERWNQRWRASNGPLGPPHPLVMSLCASLPAGARVLDIAAGRGRQSLALARAGLSVTAVDISAVALTRLAEDARAEGIPVVSVVADLLGGVPADVGGPFDAIVCVDYLNIDLLTQLGAFLAPAGRLVVSVATRENYTRHAHPSCRFLAPDDLDLASLTGLLPVRSDVGWRDDGRHTLWFVGEPMSDAVVPPSYRGS